MHRDSAIFEGSPHVPVMLPRARVFIMTATCMDGAFPAVVCRLDFRLVCVCVCPRVAGTFTQGHYNPSIRGVTEPSDMLQLPVFCSGSSGTMAILPADCFVCSILFEDKENARQKNVDRISRADD